MTGADVVDGVAGWLAGRDVGHPLRLGVDGVCGSGKPSLARELVAAVRARGRVAVHLDSDGFHQVRAVRYRQGRASARGYYQDAYDFAALRDRVLTPLGPGGSRVCATKVHDMGSDAVVTDAVATVPRDAVVVFDCTFLQRGGLRDYWDEVIYLQVDRDVAVRRGWPATPPRWAGCRPPSGRTPTGTWRRATCTWPRKAPRGGPRSCSTTTTRSNHKSCAAWTGPHCEDRAVLCVRCAACSSGPRRG